MGGKPFEFSPGEGNGRSRVTVFRIGQDFTKLDQQRALSLRSTFSIGVNAFNSTVNGTDATTGQQIPDSRFFAWVGQAQYVRRIGQSDSPLILRGNVRIAANPLLPLEQFSIGGFDTVRGYRENEIVRDNGAVVSAEVHIPILRRAEQSLLDLALRRLQPPMK